MKRAFVLLALIASLACASSHDSGPPVVVRLAPLDMNSSAFYFRGPIGLRYAVEVSNPADETVTLRRLDLRSTGGGAYSLRADSTPMNVKVAPKSNATFAITTWGPARGGEIRPTAPPILHGPAPSPSPKRPSLN